MSRGCPQKYHTAIEEKKGVTLPNFKFSPLPNIDYPTTREMHQHPQVEAYGQLYDLLAVGLLEIYNCTITSSSL
ncbi:unnamed protein product [Victoria cruziana]